MIGPQYFEGWAIAFMLILTRVSLFLAMLPWFGDRSMPRLVKVGMAVALTYLWFGELVAGTSKESFSLAAGHWLALAIAVGREALFGAVLGYWFSLLLLPARIAGSYIGQEMGLTMATVTDPATQVSGNVVGTLFETFALAVFFVADIHHVVLGVLQASFVKFPVGGEAQLGLPIVAMSGRVAAAHHWGLELAAPVAICLFLNLVAMALLMKAVPQLNLFSVGLTLRLSVGFLATFLFLPEMIAMVAGAVGNAAQSLPF